MVYQDIELEINSDYGYFCDPDQIVIKYPNYVPLITNHNIQIKPVIKFGYNVNSECNLLINTNQNNSIYGFAKKTSLTISYHIIHAIQYIFAELSFIKLSCHL
jgi:hypothetical protein